jgi:hypothetical protein
MPLCVAQSASAVELGEILSVSRVGGALRVEIELAAVDASFPRQSNCFTLATDPSNPEGLPVLANGRATLRTLDGRHSVIINSNQRLGEAAALGLRLGCSINAGRDYRLQLPPEPPAPVDVLVAPTFPEPAQRPIAAPKPPRKALPPSARPRKAVDRVELSLSPADEALARSLAQPLPAAAKPPASGPADYAAAGAVASQLDAQLRELEATVAKLRAEIEASNRAQARGPAAAGDAGAPLAPAAAADGARAVVPRSLKPAAGEEAGFATDWLPGILAGGGVLALAAFAGRRWWRRRAAERADAEAKQRLVTRQQAAVSGPAGGEGDADAAGAQASHKIDVVEPKSPLELADFLLSFGKVDDAAMALEEHIAGNPRGAIEPWRKLLDVYRQIGRRHAFEALARRMEKTFNVPAPPW